ncbi:MAG: peptidoglycan-binding protein [Bacteroidetes bacterium]|nr:peptidoglycan-binding protein [Bacteroidota bacterium]
MSRQTIIDTAASQNGTVESPPNSNKTKYGKWYGLDGVKWCAIFVSWVYDHAGHHMERIDTVNGYQSCQSGYNFWKRNGCLVKDPQPGDVVLYDWGGDGVCDHTGIFVQWVDAEKTMLMAWEGNTEQGNDSDGGRVMLRQRKRSLVKAFATPKVLSGATGTTDAEFLQTGDAGSDVAALQSMLLGLGYVVKVDGIFGPGTENAVKAFQQKQKLQVTGIVTTEVMGAIEEENSMPKVPGKKFSSGSYLRKGDSGSAVLSLQEALNARNTDPHVEEDGVFGTVTQKALKAFQQLANLDVDGIAGPATFHALGMDVV